MEIQSVIGGGAGRVKGGRRGWMLAPLALVACGGETDFGTGATVTPRGSIDTFLLRLKH